MYPILQWPVRTSVIFLISSFVSSITFLLKEDGIRLMQDDLIRITHTFEIKEVLDESLGILTELIGQSHGKCR